MDSAIDKSVGGVPRQSGLSQDHQECHKTMRNYCWEAIRGNVALCGN